LKAKEEKIQKHAKRCPPQKNLAFLYAPECSMLGAFRFSAPPLGLSAF